jgi:hypothetical protein
MPNGIEKEVDNRGAIFRGHQFGDLEGSLLTVIEGIGLPEKQEYAIKCQVRKEIWKAWSNQVIAVPKSADEEVFRIIEEKIRGEKKCVDPRS